MSWVSLSEFKRLTSLPDTVLVWLLCHDKLPCRAGTKHSIEINTSDVRVANLAKAIAEAATSLEPDFNRELVERCGAVLAEEFGRILEDAVRKV